MSFCINICIRYLHIYFDKMSIKINLIHLFPSFHTKFYNSINSFSSFYTYIKLKTLNTRYKKLTFSKLCQVNLNYHFSLVKWRTLNTIEPQYIFLDPLPLKVDTTSILKKK